MARRRSRLRSLAGRHVKRRRKAIQKITIGDYYYRK